MEAVAWSMILTGCALFGMLALWVIRGVVSVQKPRRQQAKIRRAI